MANVVFDLIQMEQGRQESTINLIASENYTSKECLQAAGSILTNKYAEGYPGHRYYGGCEIIDEIENYAIGSAKKLFCVDHVNVQPHSGSSANMAAYMALLKPGDTVLGMALSAGGHLTHGHKVNFSGKFYNFISYGVSPENEQIDYDEIDLLADQHKPKMIVAGTSAYSRILDYTRLSEIAQRHKAFLFVDMAHIAGLIAAKVHPSPVPFADIISSTTHKTLRGPRGGFLCCKGEYVQKIEKAVMPGSQGGPLMNIIAAKAIAFDEAAQPSFVAYQKQVLANAKTMAKVLTDCGYRIVSGGTDTHLFLVDLTNNGVTGAQAERALGLCNIVLNRNAIPFDKQSPMITSGIRIGTPAVTTRGMKKSEATQIALWIDEAIKKRDDEMFLSKLREMVVGMCGKFRVY